MADLIDRAALGIGRANPLIFDKPEYAGGWNAAIEIIEKAPAVDAVKVVRCKECQHWGNTNPYTANRLPCKWCTKFCNITTENAFCSYGERKET